MARQSTTKQSNSFINGIVTDSNEFAAPENASKDMVNVEITQEGEAKRRNGFGTAGGTPTSNTTVDADEVVTQCVRWSGAGRFNRSSNITICQEGSFLSVYDPSDGAWPAPSDTVDLLTAQPIVVRADAEVVPWSFTEGEEGTMYVATGVCRPLRLFYNETSNALSWDVVTMYIRDTTYLVDGINFAARVAHGAGAPYPHNMEYNIMNGGWSGTPLGGHKLNVGNTTPAKSDQVWRAKLASGFPDYPFIAAQFASQEPAPAGHYLWPLVETDRLQYLSGTNTVDERTIPLTLGPSVVVFYASRIWYLGHTVDATTEDGLASTIYYSQVIREIGLVGDTTTNYNPANHNSYEACYSVNDPTSEYNNQVLATDGGAITIPALGVVRRASVIGSALILFTNRGVYAIKGSTGQSFQADDFVIDQISDEVATSFQSIVEVGSSVLFWSSNGIIEIKPSEVERGEFVAVSITKGRYQQGFLSLLINNSYQQTTTGFYDFRNNYVEWTYSQGSGVDEKRAHNHIIRLNLVTGAITRYKFNPGITIPPRRLGGMTLFDVSGDEDTMYYLTRSGDGFGTAVTTEWHTLSNNTDYKDFEGTSHEQETLPFLTMWPEHIGAPHLNKQVNYLHTYVRRTEENWISAGTFDNESGLQVTGYWDWAEESASGKKSGPHDVYRMLRLPADPGSGYPVDLDYYPTVIVNKTKIKGKGRAIQLKFEGKVGKDFQLMGWSLPITAEVVSG